MSGMPGNTDPSKCPAPPAGASASAVQAWMAVNTTRLAAGSVCINLVAGDMTRIDHVWMDFNSSNVDPGYRYYLANVAFAYSNTPLAANTKCRMKITGMDTGGALNLEWTFTTGTANPFGP